MVDSGALENFVDQFYCDKNDLTFTPKLRPHAVHLVGSSAMATGPVTHTATIQLNVDEHRETITRTSHYTRILSDNLRHPVATTTQPQRTVETKQGGFPL